MLLGFDYACNLKLKTQNAKLNESGYRKISNDNYECVVDIGNIGSDYMPGHAHADTFNFELRIDGNPFIVDTGLSTYEASDRRNKERGTVSHNTVEVAEKDSSEIWNGFRVANRAKIIGNYSPCRRLKCNLSVIYIVLSVMYPIGF